MNCWHCGTDLTWGSDDDVEGNEEFFMVSFFTCQNCNSYVEFYTAKDVDDERD